MDAPLYRSRYPHHDVLARAETWDEVTRDLVLARVLRPPPYRFFRPDEVATLEALADTVVPQDDRPPERRVPLVPFLDERLHRGEGPGYRYEGLPPDREFWRLVARACDEEARAVAAASFADATQEQRREAFAGVVAGRPRSRGWEGVALDVAVSVVLQEFVRGYYAHPFAWDEIGFPGPKFPGIYARTAPHNPEEPVEVALAPGRP